MGAVINRLPARGSWGSALLGNAEVHTVSQPLHLSQRELESRHPLSVTG